MALGTDPLTGNRYLFAAANPVAFYEDGHAVCADTKGKDCQYEPYTGSIWEVVNPPVQAISTLDDFLEEAERARPIRYIPPSSVFRVAVRVVGKVAPLVQAKVDYDRFRNEDGDTREEAFIRSGARATGAIAGGSVVLAGCTAANVVGPAGGALCGLGALVVGAIGYAVGGLVGDQLAYRDPVKGAYPYEVDNYYGHTYEQQCMTPGFYSATGCTSNYP